MAQANATILIVDDEPDLREVLCLELETEGFEVRSAGSGNEALRLARENPVQIVVSDLRMGDGDGIFLLEQLKLLPGRMPAVVLMSGYSDMTDQEAIAKGATALIMKPFRTEMLLTLIRSQLNG